MEVARLILSSRNTYKINSKSAKKCSILSSKSEPILVGTSKEFSPHDNYVIVDTNSKKLIKEVEEALKSGGVNAAKEVCRNTAGPVASIFYQGLDRIDHGVESAEKAVVSYGGVQMGQLERNVSWISLFIALAPMLGFMGTVIGMIQAFDKIEAAGNMDASLVAGGIKVALLTTVFGLIVAMILQVFYNYIVAKIDSIVNDMEDASISLVDILVDYKNKK